MKALIMAGGTGGHVIPALSIARRLQEQGWEILWLGARGRMEEALVPKAGFCIAYIDVHGLRRNGLKTMLGAPLMILKALLQARRVIKDFKPDIAIGMGGYASGPGGLAAKMAGIPLILHEQNAAAGMTNRLLFKICNKALLGFPGAFTGPKTVVTGNPVRPEIAALAAVKREFMPAKTLRLLILGGSLGAQALNVKLPPLLVKFYQQALRPQGIKLSLIHQCGKGGSAAAAQRYQELLKAEGAGFKVKVSDFIDDMAGLYQKTDLIICRSGALTCAETAAAGLPAVYIPLPTAVDDHQTKNALTQVEAGGAALIAQADLTYDTLSAALTPLCSPQALNERSERQKAAAKLDAPGLILNEIYRSLGLNAEPASAEHSGK